MGCPVAVNSLNTRAFKLETFESRLLGTWILASRLDEVDGCFGRFLEHGDEELEKIFKSLRSGFQNLMSFECVVKHSV